MIGKVLKIAQNPSVQRNVAGFFKKGVRSKLAEHLRRTTQKTKGGKLRIFQKGKTKEIYGSRRAVQEGLFEHTEQTLKTQGRRTTTGYGNVNIRDLSKPTGFMQGKPNVSGGLDDLVDSLKIGFKDKATEAKHTAERLLRRAQQTVKPGRLLSKGYQTKGGHHHLGLDMGDAITTGMPNKLKRQMWRELDGKYKNIFSGDHWANMRYLPEGKLYKSLINEKTASVHKQTHSQLRRYGLDVKSLKKMFKGKNLEERKALMAKIDHKMKRMDQWIFLRMKKWKGGEEALWENLRIGAKVRKDFKNLSPAKRREKIKELLAEGRGEVAKETESVAELFRQPLDKASMNSPLPGGTTLGGKK